MKPFQNQELLDLSVLEDSDTRGEAEMVLRMMGHSCDRVRRVAEELAEDGRVEQTRGDTK